MQIKTIATLAAVLGALLVLSVLVYFKTQPPPRSEDVFKPYFPDFNDQIAGRIILEKSATGEKGKEKKAEKVEVAKIDNTWVVANRFNYPAQEKQVNSILDTLKNVRRGEVISSRKDGHERFEVSDDKALHLRVDDVMGTMMADIYIGKQSGRRGSFARAAGSDDVRLLGFDRPDILFSTAMSSWLNTSCFGDFQADNVTGIAVRQPEFTFMLLKVDTEDPDPKCASKTIKKTVWNLVEPEKKEAKKGVAAGLASHIVRLSIEDVVDDRVKPEYGFDNATMVVEASVAGRGNAITITFGAQKEIGEAPRPEKKYYMRISDRKHVFLVSRAAFDMFSKKLDDLREKPKEKPKKPEEKPVKPGEEKKPEKSEEKPGEKAEAPKAPGRKPEQPEKKPAGEQKKPAPPEGQPKKDDAGKKDSPGTDKPENKGGGVPPLPPPQPESK